jgi:uncharacterized membrane protein (UPF0127 family)
MGYPIDIVALDKRGAVVAIATVKPWRVGPWLWSAYSTLELAAGEASRLGVRLGDTPVLRERHRIDEKATVR